MCGIVGGVAQRDVKPILLEGLRRLEYRGYDSAGIAVLGTGKNIDRVRSIGKVKNLSNKIQEHELSGGTGIAHTRWATHGVPAEHNAHPHICNQRIAVVHNGIIENHEDLRKKQLEAGYTFTSETDTEVIAHQIVHYLDDSDDLLGAVFKAIEDLEGAYALGVICVDNPDEMIVVREGSPLLIGVGLGENFIASDIQALLPVTSRFIYLENGEFARITRHKIDLFDASLDPIEREPVSPNVADSSISRGTFKHYMLKEIYEQPNSITDTLDGRLVGNEVNLTAFGNTASTLFKDVKHIQIVACGTSFHAGLVAKYWFENYIGISCNIEVASEYRYRRHVVLDNSLFVTLSQSGETADTLAALRLAQEQGFIATLAICNVDQSSLVRESDLVLLTRAGPEIGVASTKAFTTQLVALQLLVLALGQSHDISPDIREQLISGLRSLPQRVELALDSDGAIASICEDFIDKHHALFLGRGPLYPIAMEGALKLKEISYIHAEAYPAGELKHGPLALVDEQMPIIAVAPNDGLFEKLRSNLEEVKARGGKLYVFTPSAAGMENDETTTVIEISDIPESVAPIVNVVYLQLLSYHTAVLKGTDVDQPRNLAKSVTVE